VRLRHLTTNCLWTIGYPKHLIRRQFRLLVMRERTGRVRQSGPRSAASCCPRTSTKTVQHTNPTPTHPTLLMIFLSASVLNRQTDREQPHQTATPHLVSARSVRFIVSLFPSFTHSVEVVSYLVAVMIIRRAHHCQVYLL
jgi:hypothetical protein